MFINPLLFFLAVAESVLRNVCVLLNVNRLFIVNVITLSLSHYNSLKILCLIFAFSTGNKKSFKKSFSLMKDSFI